MAQTTKKEPVLLVPPRLTQSAYALLVKNNLVPRKWHLEGRYGSRTFRPSKHRDNHEETGDKSARKTEHEADGDEREEDRRMGLPLLQCAANRIESNSRRDLDDELQALLVTPGVEIAYLTVPHPRSAPRPEHIDATIHPELRPSVPPTLRRCPKPSSSSSSSRDESDAQFTFMELFSGIGGFGVALEVLGGQCLFASEINDDCNKIYLDNLTHAPKYGMHGDIYKVSDAKFPRAGECDLLVAGFPCQPFSRLGAQPGFADADRGLLYTQIVRALKASRPRSFLLENVPGLAEMAMGESLNEIVASLEEVGYNVVVEVVSARGLTAQARKRLFFVGYIRQNGITDEKEKKDDEKSDASSAPFRFPFIPDLGLRARDIIEYDDKRVVQHTTDDDEKNSYRLSPAQMDQLLNRSKRWKPAKLAWPDNVLETLDGHYGITIGKGNSQLVPGTAPSNPRLFTPRECARCMGFPYWFTIPDMDVVSVDVGGKNDDDDSVAERAHRKRLYLMFGNAVCVPLIVVLAGAVLDGCKEVSLGKEAADNTKDKEVNWRMKGLELAISLSLESILDRRRNDVEDRLVKAEIVNRF